LNIERPAKTFDEMAERTEPGDMIDMRRMQQPIDHVQDEKRLHAIVREALPRFGKSDVGQPARMPDKTAVLRIVHGAK